MWRWIASVALVWLASMALTLSVQMDTATFSPHVDANGAIRVPDGYRQWPFLGSWHIAPERGVGDVAGAAGFHNVYVDPGTVEHFQRTGAFRDGAVIVKELLGTAHGRLTTGEVSWSTDVEGWFVMIKDTRNRFPAHPLWGEGWGWALINADRPDHVVTRHFEPIASVAISPARQTDWVFLQGYPTLARPRR